MISVSQFAAVVPILAAQSNSSGVIHCWSHPKLGSHLQFSSLLHLERFGRGHTLIAPHSDSGQLKMPFRLINPPFISCCPPTSKKAHKLTINSITIV
ncbi:hypothetical protein QBC36DRAFT_340281 [Triangularia setosa]|uniref:Uncharacterized protein n=1 Tax=Triangularia setosa TaxID=2587417 RepID=A0AAN6VXM8_9PEZI|nr:hypothetical protein QBC36DRAFT_340281 [Podospora setosa]